MTAPRAKLAASAAVLMPFITVVAAILLAVAGYFLLLVPKIRPLMAGGAYDFSAIKTQLASDEDYIKKMMESLDGYSKLEEAKLSRVAAIMPLEADIPGLMVQIDEIARANKMALQSIDTATDEKNVSPLGRKVVRISLSLTGGDYAQFKLLLADLERSLRLFDVATLSFGADGKAYGVVLKTYYIDRKATPTAKK